MPTTIRRVGVCGIALGLLGILPASAAADQASAVEAAARFGAEFLAGRDEALEPLMTGPMRQALGGGKSAELRASLVERFGAVTVVGEAWYEDSIQGFRRVRVPLTFERDRLDLRLVIGSDGLVAGMFFVAHVEPPEAVPAPADPADRQDPEGPRGPANEVEVHIGSAQSGLPGTLSLPPGEGPFPAVVLVHGSGPNDRDETLGANKPFRDLAWGLARHGIAVLRYDKRSLVHPGELARIGGSLTVVDEVIDDAVAALALLRERGEIDSGRLFVLGHSLGGTLAPRVAAASGGVAGMIVMAGLVRPLPETMLEQTRYIAELDGQTSPEEQARLDELAATVADLRAALDGDAPEPAGYVLGAPLGYFRDLEQHDPPAEAAASGLPVLVLQGGRDYQVTLEDLAGWRRGLSGIKAACVVVYDELDHLFRAGSGPSGPADYDRRESLAPRVIDEIAGWILERRCPGAAPPPA